MIRQETLFKVNKDHFGQKHCMTLIHNKKKGIRCCILVTRSTYSPVNFNWELVDRNLFLHFLNHYRTFRPSHWYTFFFLCFHFFIFTLDNKTLVYVSYLFSCLCFIFIFLYLYSYLFILGAIIKHAYIFSCDRLFRYLFVIKGFHSRVLFTV